MSVRIGVTALAMVFASCTGGGGGSETPPGPGGETDAPAPAADAGGTRDTLVIGYQADIGQLMSVVYEAVADANILETLSFPIVDAELVGLRTHPFDGGSGDIDGSDPPAAPGEPDGVAAGAASQVQGVAGRQRLGRLFQQWVGVPAAAASGAVVLFPERLSIESLGHRPAPLAKILTSS